MKAMRGRVAALAVASAALVAVSPVPASAATVGELAQMAGSAGCVSEDGTGGSCGDGVALDGAASVTVSPDGHNVYAASLFGDAVVVFDRDPVSGVLAQKAGRSGCVSETGTGGSCVDGVALDGASSVSVSPEGHNVYAASISSGAVVVFDRDPVSGALAQKVGLAGCVSETGTGGSCVDGVALNKAVGVSVSPEGRNAYVTSGGLRGGAVVVFDRDPVSGALAQKAGLAGCVSETGTGGSCADGVALNKAVGVSVSPEGRNAYVTSGGLRGGAVVVFDRDPVSGALAQKAGLAGCVSETGTGGSCADGVALRGASSVSVSPDGDNVYAASGESDALVAFDRSTSPPPPGLCDGREVTVDLAQGQSPTDGADVIRGTPAGEAIAARGGDDVVCAGGGNDAVTGGVGGDTIRGGSGDDRLRGQAGDDTLRGGPGTDTCRGGSGADAALSCETVIGVP